MSYRSPGSSGPHREQVECRSTYGWTRSSCAHSIFGPKGAATGRRWKFKTQIETVTNQNEASMKNSSNEKRRRVAVRALKWVTAAAIVALCATDRSCGKLDSTGRVLCRDRAGREAR